MMRFLRIWLPSALVLTVTAGCAGYLWPEKVEHLWESMRFFESDTLFIVVEREVRYRTIVIGSGDNTHSSTRFYYRLDFRPGKGTGLAELDSVKEVSHERRETGYADHLKDDQLAPLVSRKKENLFLVENWVDAKQKPAGAIGLKVRRWNGSPWYLVRRNGEADVVTNETYSVTYTCPPTDALDPLWGCWDVDAGLVLFTESKSLPPYELGYLPPKAYLWYYRENRVETYTLDRVAVDKALRQFIRKQK